MAGRIQDQFGSKKVIMVGTFMAGIGMVLSSLSINPIKLCLSFGGLTGTGIGFSYACLNPTAMKWFHASRKGTLATAFGLAAFYLAPLTSFLLSKFDLQVSLQILGAGLLVIAFPLACSFTNPPTDFKSVPARAKQKLKAVKPSDDVTW